MRTPNQVRRAYPTSAAVPALFAAQPPLSRAARLLSRAWPALVSAFAELHVVRTVAIIGSYATGTPTSSSDLDVLVLVRGTEMPSNRIFSMCVKLGMLLTCDVNALIYSNREFAQRLRERDPQARHMARGALLVKGALPPGAPRRRRRRAAPTRHGVIPLDRSISRRKIANLIETADSLLSDSRLSAISDLGRIGAALEAVRYLVNAVLEAEGYRLKGEDIDGAAFQRAKVALCKPPLDRLYETYRTHARGELYQVTPDTRERILMEAREFYQSARDWLSGNR